MLRMSHPNLVKELFVSPLWSLSGISGHKLLMSFFSFKVKQVNFLGMITTRLLVPSNEVGCILGQGGQVINEMRRTQADIRVLSKDDKPRCASADEELVQVIYL